MSQLIRTSSGIGRTVAFAMLAALIVAGLIAPAIAQEKPAGKSSPQAIKQYRDAVAFQNRGVYDLAADEWQAFLTKFADDPLAGKAQHYLGVCLLQQKKIDEAIAAFEKAIKDYPASDITEQSYLNLGLAQYSAAQAGKAEAFDQAGATFAALAEKYPQSPHLAQAVFYRAESLYARGKKAESAPLYARFVAEFKDSPLRPDALYALGVTQEELGQPVEAGATFDLFLKEFDKHRLRAEVIMRRAETLFAQQKYAEAEKWFASAAAAADFKLADYSLVRQAACLYEQKKYPEAATLYAQAAQKYPDSTYVATATLAAGNCYYLAGNLPEAAKWFGKAIAAGGENSIEATHWLAKCLLKEHKPAEALAKVEQALTTAGDSPFKARLLLDKADALYELPDRRADSVAIYAQVAKEYAQDAVAPQAAYMAAFASLGLGQHQAALDYAKAFAAAYPNDALLTDVNYVAAEANLLLGHHAEAEALYRQLLAKHADRPDAEIWQVRLGLLQFLQKKYPETISQLTAALPSIKSPALIAEAQHLIGTSQLELEQSEAAVKSLTAALAALPNWRQADETLLNLATAQRQLGQWQPAKDAAAKVLAEFPQTKLADRAHYRLADIAYAQGDFAGAIPEYQIVVEKYADSPLAPHAIYWLGWSQLGLAQAGKGDFAAAAETFSQMIDKFGDHALAARAKYARGIARQQLKDFSGAAEDVSAFLATNPPEAEQADALYVLGLCQVGMQKFDEAVKTFNQILAKHPQYGGTDKVLYELGWAQKSAGHESEAVAAFTKLTADHANSPLAAESLYHVGESQYAAKNYAEAAKSYYAAMMKAKEAGLAGDLAEKAAHKLAWAYYQQQQFDKAAESFEFQAKNYAGGELAADALFMAAESLFKQNKFEPAWAAYQKSLAQLPANPDYQALIYLHAGQTAAQRKAWAESGKLLDEAIKKFADSPYLSEMKYEYAWALQNQGKTDEAFKLFDTVAATTDTEVGARARFMMGEIEFEKKEYKEAIRNFFKVAYGYGYPNSPEAFQKWQASAAYEAGRCFETVATAEPNRKESMLEQAKKSYKEVIEKYPTSDKAALAKARLEAIGG